MAAQVSFAACGAIYAYYVVGERPADIAAGIRTLREIGIKTLKLNGTEGLAMIDSAATADPAVGRIAAVRKK